MAQTTKSSCNGKYNIPLLTRQSSQFFLFFLFSAGRFLCSCSNSVVHYARLCHCLSFFATCSKCAAGYSCKSGCKSILLNFTFHADLDQGLKYFGTATDNPSTDAAYSAELSNTSDFGQLTPANAQKVEFKSVDIWGSGLTRRNSGMRLSPARGPLPLQQAMPSSHSSQRMSK